MHDDLIPISASIPRQYPVIVPKKQIGLWLERVSFLFMDTLVDNELHIPLLLLIFFIDDLFPPSVFVASIICVFSIYKV